VPRCGRSYHSYVESVTVSGGVVSGGGTRTSSYIVFDFGWAVHNRTAATVRFRVDLQQRDAQGYVLNTRPFSHDIAPGQRRRMWAGLTVRENHDLARYVLSEIGFRPATQGAGPQGMTSPNVSLFDVFGLAGSPLATSTTYTIRLAVGCLLSVVGIALIGLAFLFVAIASVTRH
jgi:hypothetical protein